jgi:hypothetical protein
MSALIFLNSQSDEEAPTRAHILCLHHAQHNKIDVRSLNQRWIFRVNRPMKRLSDLIHYFSASRFPSIFRID